MQRLELELSVGLYRNTARRWALHCFCNRVGVPEVVLVTLTKWFGVRRWHLSHVMAEHKQLPGHIVLAMPASMPIRQGGTFASRAAIRPRASFSRKTTAPLASRPTKCSVFLPVSMPIVQANPASVFRDMAMCSSCF